LLYSRQKLFIHRHYIQQNLKTAAVSVKRQAPSKRPTDGQTPRYIRGVCPSVGLSRVAATSTRRDGGERRGRCCRACLSVRPSVRLLDGV